MAVIGALGYGMVNGWSTVGFVLGRAPFESVFPISLTVVPLFVMMGVFSAYGGLSSSLYRLVSAVMGHLKGGLAMATIGACAVFGAVCGSAIATAATMGRVAMPEMRRAGYDDRLASATIASGGTLGVMIPPSILFVIYGLMTEQSIGKLFAAGVLPGIAGTLLYMAAIRYTTWRHPEQGPAAPRAAREERRKALLGVWPVLLLFGVVLGGMYVGFFSPTEAAGVGAFGAILISFLLGRMDRKGFFSAVRETALTTGMIFMILIGAGIFNYFIDSTGLPDQRGEGSGPLALDDHVPPDGDVLRPRRPDGRAGDDAAHRGAGVQARDRARLRPDLVRRDAGDGVRDRHDPAAGGHQPLRHPERSRAAACHHRARHHALRGSGHRAALPHLRRARACNLAPRKDVNWGQTPISAKMGSDPDLWMPRTIRS